MGLVVRVFFILVIFCTFNSYALAQEEEITSPNADFVNALPDFELSPLNNTKLSITKFNADFNEINIYNFLISSKQSYYFCNDETFESSEKMQPFFEAIERYEQGNITASYNTFEEIINGSSYNDFYYMLMAYKLADIGFFSLSEVALNKVFDVYVWSRQINAIKESYFPKYKHSLEEEMFLANVNSSINYSNLTQESVTEIVKKDKIKRRSDYALYLIAQAFYIDKKYDKALKRINRAVKKNPKNVYYGRLKAQILCELGKYKDSIKVVRNIEQKEGLSPQTLTQLDSIRYISLAELEKKSLKSKYYLAMYFFMNKDYTKALNELAIINYKNKLPEGYSLAGDIYFLNKDFEKAIENYNKALKVNKRHSEAYNGLANVFVLKQDYDNAEKYYKKSLKYDKKNIEGLLNLALVKTINRQKDEYEKLFAKIERINPDLFQISYIKSKFNSDKAQMYLRKAIQLNPYYSDSWLDLAKCFIVNDSVMNAEQALSSVKFLENKTYRYYYYNALVAKIYNEDNEAENDFKKAVNLYSKNSSVLNSIPVADIKEL